MLITYVMHIASAQSQKIVRINCDALYVRLLRVSEVLNNSVV